MKNMIPLDMFFQNITIYYKYIAAETSDQIVFWRPCKCPKHHLFVTGVTMNWRDQNTIYQLGRASTHYDHSKQLNNNQLIWCILNPFGVHLNKVNLRIQKFYLDLCKLLDPECVIFLGEPGASQPTTTTFRYGKKLCLTSGCLLIK
jgi:hypothetical protein